MRRGCGLPDFCCKSALKLLKQFPLALGSDWTSLDFECSARVAQVPEESCSLVLAHVCLQNLDMAVPVSVKASVLLA